MVASWCFIVELSHGLFQIWTRLEMNTIVWIAMQLFHLKIIICWSQNVKMRMEAKPHGHIECENTSRLYIDGDTISGRLWQLHRGYPKDHKAVAEPVGAIAGRRRLQSQWWDDDDSKDIAAITGRMQQLYNYSASEQGDECLQVEWYWNKLFDSDQNEFHTCAMNCTCTI